MQIIYRQMILSILLVATIFFSACPQNSQEPLLAKNKLKNISFDSEGAFAGVKKLLAIGPRIVGTAGNLAARNYLKSSLRKIARLKVETDTFRAKTPSATIEMANLIGKIPGDGQVIILSCHFDTVKIAGKVINGANDAASACGALLELARVLAQKKYKEELWFVFFDGEEALQKWGKTDGLYGSRQLAKRLAKEQRLKRIKYLINLDMIGDKDLGIAFDLNSERRLLELTGRVARKLGYSKYFFQYSAIVEDDHYPFKQLAVKTLELIDFRYGGNSSPGDYWHTEEDTLDKLSKKSISIVAQVVLELLDGYLLQSEEG